MTRGQFGFYSFPVRDFALCRSPGALTLFFVHLLSESPDWEEILLMILVFLGSSYQVLTRAWDYVAIVTRRNSLEVVAKI
jgi:hypothetical protein